MQIFQHKQHGSLLSQANQELSHVIEEAQAFSLQFTHCRIRRDIPSDGFHFRDQLNQFRRGGADCRARLIGWERAQIIL